VGPGRGGGDRAGAASAHRGVQERAATEAPVMPGQREKDRRSELGTGSPSRENCRASPAARGLDGGPGVGDAY
jgi:hypothetical protein